MCDNPTQNADLTFVCHAPGDPLTQLLVTQSGPFSDPGFGNFGNTRRNSYTGPGEFLSDMSIFKNFTITERVHAQFQAEFFNVFNHPVYGNPNSCVDCSNGGLITGLGGNSLMRQLQLRFRVTILDATDNKQPCPGSRLLPPLPPASSVSQPDEALQTVLPPSSLASGVSFDGASYTQYRPPDPNIAVSSSYIVEGTNVQFTVYNKSGTLLATINPWSGFGGPCQTNQGGDPIVQYDRSADRWVITQLANDSGPTYYYCFSASQTINPTGSYYRCAYTFTSLADYPKVGVWPTAYFASFHMFQGRNTFTGAQLCAYNRSQMLAGNAPAPPFSYT